MLIPETKRKSLERLTGEEQWFPDSDTNVEDTGNIAASNPENEKTVALE